MRLGRLVPHHFVRNARPADDGFTPTNVSVIATLRRSAQLSVLGHLHRSSDTPREIPRGYDA
jgi:hypothetical protein